MLAIQNLSRDTTFAYVAEALTNEIATALGRVRRLEVKSTGEVLLAQRAAAGNGRRLGQILNVRYLVAGTVLPGRSRIRVTVQLVEAAPGNMRWGEAFSEPADDVGAVLDTVTQAVATAIAGELLPEERRTLTRHKARDPEALRLYWRGQRVLNIRYDSIGFRRALALYERAVARDSLFADAWAAIANVWRNFADTWIAPLEAYPRAEHAAQRALAIDSSAAGAYAVLAWKALALDHDIARAEALAHSAIALDPRLDSFVAAAAVDWARSRPDDAQQLTLRGWELDTTSYYAALFALGGFGEARRFDDMESFLSRLRTIFPESDFSLFRGILLLERGRCAEAIEPLRRVSGQGMVPVVLLGEALVCAGRRAEARAIEDSLESVVAHGGYVSADAIGALHAATGDRDGAFAWLERGYKERAFGIMLINVSPFWDGMRDDPRFVAMTRRIGLPDPTRP